jgi:hypothetical protein
VAAPSFSDDFDGPDLDGEVWVAHYLPQWSSRAQTAATYELDGSELRLTIAPEQGVWCAGDHEPPLRVSGVQSGVWSGPVGGTAGQQPYRDGLVVREAQPAQWGWTPLYGLVEVRARMELGPSAMAAAWLAGVEDEPRRSGEICLFEVFGDALTAGDGGPSAAVGVGVHPFRDPALTDDFAAEPLAIDVREPHVYAADWRRGRVEFLVDGRVVRSVAQAPDYPMQMMFVVFDFPERAPGAPGAVPLLAVDRVAGPASARW